MEKDLSPQQILDKLSSDDLAALLGRKSFTRHSATGPVTMNYWSKLRQTSLPWDPESAAHTGPIAKVPDSVWSQVFAYLGFRDLGRLMRSCRLLRCHLQGWSVWKDISNNVGEIIHVLGAAFILDLHTPQKVHDTLRKGDCTHCDCGFGGFVNLLSFERACSSCARDVYDQWALDSETLCTAYALDDAQIRDLPTMRRIPHRGDKIAEETLPFARRKILLLRDVRQRALEIHGGQKGLEAAVSVRYGPIEPQDFLPLTVHHLHFLDLTGSRRKGLSFVDDVDLDGFDGKSNGHVSFPVLTEPGREPDGGYFCRPCETRFGGVTGQTMDLPGMNGIQELHRPAYARMDQEYSRDALAKHLRNPEECPGAVDGIVEAQKKAEKTQERSNKRKREDGRDGGRDDGKAGRSRKKRAKRVKHHGREDRSEGNGLERRVIMPRETTRGGTGGRGRGGYKGGVDRRRRRQQRPKGGQGGKAPGSSANTAEETA